MVSEMTFTEARVQGGCGGDYTEEGEAGITHYRIVTSTVYPEGRRHAGLGRSSLETQD